MGGCHGVAQILEDIFSEPLKRLKSTRCGRLLIGIGVFAFCNIAWIFFRAESLGDAIYVIKSITYNINAPLKYIQNNIGLNLSELAKIVVSIALVAAFDAVSVKQDVFALLEKWPKAVRWMCGYVLIAMIMWYGLNSSGANQFVYFQF